MLAGSMRLREDRRWRALRSSLAFEALGIVTGQEVPEPRELLERMVSMLTKMALAEVNRGK
jgi:hypothetical protein